METSFILTTSLPDPQSVLTSQLHQIHSEISLMSFSLRSLVVLAALAVPVLAHADTFAGTASFQDGGPINGVDFSGSFDQSSFLFSGPVGTTFSDGLTITSTDAHLLNTANTDNLSVSLVFTLPGMASDTITGTGSLKDTFVFIGYIDQNTINWSNNVSYINFANGAQLKASLPDFNFTGFDGYSQGSENLTLQVTKVAATPEPSTFALLGTGLVGAVGAIRRKLSR